jgi:hypothetical protein
LLSSWPAHAGQAGEPQAYLESLHCQEGPYALVLPPTLDGLRALGKPVRERNGPSEAQAGEGYSISRKTLEFDGLVLQLIVFSNDKQRYMLASAEISSPRWSIAGPFRIGASLADTRTLLGKAAQDDEGLHAEYGGDVDSLRFEQLGGRVSKISYQCYTG